ncbi:hypothetical protein CDAR_547361 [Caerostris darwini]|uniref:Uncharacterized protein n=1 Tax=Caerostris darwini TaxID=1538125 RepID=A0AAV4V814_9ARAC|nr:hypothetical protein CDAR_547361 [Caerostris darwini]
MRSGCSLSFPDSPSAKQGPFYQIFLQPGRENSCGYFLKGSSVGFGEREQGIRINRLEMLKDVSMPPQLPGVADSFITTVLAVLGKVTLQK